MKTVVITGGTRGLGFGIALGLIDAGYGVAAVGRSTPKEFAEAAERLNRDGRRLWFFGYDLNDTDGIPALVKQIRGEVGPIYGLVNNAAIGTSGVLANMSPGKIETMIRLNVLSPIIFTKQVVRGMMTEGEGRIVNVSSIVAATGYSGLSVYSATKAALVGFTKSLAREVGTLGINVNAVAPGFMTTDMTSAMQDDDRARIAHRSALNRLAEIADVVRAVEYLMGSGGRNITGTVLTIDAGNTA
jgi:3-oxoacyl-[acyl-carrier protein] reductase